MIQVKDVKTNLILDPTPEVTQDATINISSGNSDEKVGRYTLFVHIETDKGLSGFSYTSDHNTGRALETLIHDNLKHIIIGEDPQDTEKLWDKMFWQVRGYGRKGLAFQAISALDTALWDLKGKILDAPLYKILGSYQDSVPCYGSGGWTNYTIEELVEEQTSYVEQGFPRIKMKVGKDFGQSEEEDIERVAAVRKAVGKDVTIFIDANNGYYAKQAIKMSKIFEEFNVGWFEEPVLADDIQGLAEVSRSTVIPVATGEHEYTKYGFKDLISQGGADIVQPDIGRVGGVTEWMKVAHLAHSYNLPVAPHAYSLLHLHCCMATPNLKVVEILGNEMKYWPFLFNETPEVIKGQWKPFDKPGLGLEPNQNTIRNHSA